MALAEPEWTEDCRRGFVVELRRDGYTTTEADCLARAIETALEGDEPDGDEADFEFIVESTKEDCGVANG